jgi:tetratricopeptide (TPR) repeat protein/predicted Ser/Thr protein kinase
VRQGEYDGLAGGDLTGSTLGGYEILKLVGTGGGGSVYRAKSTADGASGPAGSIIALKVFHSDLLTDDRVFQRFQREAELGIKIRHPHVVRSYEVGREELDGTPTHYVAMEFIDGETLRETLEELDGVPEHLMYQVAEELLDALTAVHAEGMIHRDVKPENVVITRDKEVRLMDLGVARLQQEGRDITRAGEFVGSLAYASPEQFINQDHVDPRADIYAIGVMLYEMATGKNPFDVTDLNKLLEKKIRGPVRRPKLINRDLDPFLDEVIMSCLNADVDARFTTAEELRSVLREGDASAWWNERIESETFPASTRALNRLRTPRDAELVGRAIELERLHAAFESAAGGKAAVVFVTGAAGVGKSRFVHDFVEELVTPDGPLIMAGRFQEGAGISHRAFLDAAHDFLGEREAMERRLVELIPDMPDLVARFANQILDEDGDLAGDELVSAYTRMLRALSAERTVVLAIEDLQIADDESIALFDHLARSVADHAVLLVASYRDDDVEDGSALHSLPTNLEQRVNTTSIELGPLGREGVEQLLQGLVRQPRTVRGLIWPLLRSSDGNPHFIIEVVARLKETGALVESATGWGSLLPIDQVALPASLRTLLLLKLEGLEDQLRDTLEAAAVQGPEFDASLLAAVTGVKRIRLLKRLAVLERKHRMLASSGRSSFRFASNGLQQVVYDEMTEARRMELHSATADAIRDDQEKLEPADAEAWVRQMLRAGRLPEAVEDVPAAVEHAATHGHAADATTFMERIVDALDPEQRRLRFDVLMLLAALQRVLGRVGEQWRSLARAADVAESMGEPSSVARVRAAFASASLWAGHYDRAETEANQGLAEAEEAQDRDCRAQCLHTLGAVAYRRGDFAAAAESWTQAIEQWRDLGNRRGEAGTLIRLGAVMPEIGQAEEALPAKQEALEILREIGDRRAEGAALNDVGNAFVDADRMQEALVCFEQAVKIARELGDLPAEAAALYNTGRVYTIEARIEEGKEIFERALDIFRQIEDPSGEAEVLDELGSAMATFGDRDRALPLLEQARDAAERTGEVALLARVLRHLGTVHHEAGSREDGWLYYERALTVARSRTRSAILADMGGAAVREGDYDRATNLLEESLAGAEASRRTLLSLCRLARAHHGAGRLEEAAEFAKQAETVIDADQSVAPHYGLEVYYSLGTVLTDATRSRGYLDHANSLLATRTRAIRSVVYRDHYLTMRWPNREILDEARRLVEGG